MHHTTFYRGKEPLAFQMRHKILHERRRSVGQLVVQDVLVQTLQKQTARQRIQTEPVVEDFVDQVGSAQRYASANAEWNDRLQIFMGVK